MALCLDKRTKEKLRRLAFKNKMTMSEFVRNVIKLVLMLNDKKTLDDRTDIAELDIDKLLLVLGGIKNI